jgi:hypothetical protein
LTDADLKKLFLSQLAKVKPQVSPFVATAPDACATSYFVDVMAPEPIVREEDMIASMVDMWREQGLHGLVALEPSIRKMAKRLRAPQTPDASVSDFVYPMY